MNKLIEIINGSTLHGTQIEEQGSDLDLMSVCTETKARFIGLHPSDVSQLHDVQREIDGKTYKVDLVTYGLRKFVGLALKSNPTILQLFFVQEDQCLLLSPRGRELQGFRDMFLSKNVYGPFAGYLNEQMRRLKGEQGQKKGVRPHLVEQFGYDTKYAGHVVRLGLQGAELLREGKMYLPMRKNDAELVKKVRRGGFTFSQFETLAKDLDADLTVAYNNSPLPEKISEESKLAIESWMIDTYMEAWSKENGKRQQEVR